MTLKPQDVLVLVHLAVTEGPWSYPSVAASLGMSASEAHAAVRRATAADLLDPHTRRPARASLLEFLVHGLKYVFPVTRGGLARGIPTAHAAAPLRDRVRASREPSPVWPHPLGELRGEAWSPLYRAAPSAALRDPKLHEALALIDTIRGGRPRERDLAVKELAKRLS